MLKNQRRTTRRCPTCPTGTIYTGTNAKFNSKNVDGIAVCERCKSREILDELYSKYISTKD